MNGKIVILLAVLGIASWSVFVIQLLKFLRSL